MDRKGIHNLARTFDANSPIRDDAALEDFVRLNLRQFIGADLYIPNKGFIDFGYDFYMYFGFQNELKPHWADICSDVVFERDRTKDLFETDIFDNCIAKAGLMKNN
ncbi:MAG: hypothetical protein AAF607_01220 [Pseudomonadota bacterium]